MITSITSAHTTADTLTSDAYNALEDRIAQIFKSKTGCDLRRAHLFEKLQILVKDMATLPPTPFQEMLITHCLASTTLLQLKTPLATLATFPQENIAYFINHPSHFLTLSRDPKDIVKLLQLDSELFSFVFTPNYTFKTPSGLPNSPNPYLRRLVANNELTIDQIVTSTKAALELLCHS